MDAGRALRARSHQREGRIDDVTVPEWAVAFAAAGGLALTQGDRPSRPVGHALRVCRLRWRIRGILVAVGHLLICPGESTGVNLALQRFGLHLTLDRCNPKRCRARMTPVDSPGQIKR